MPWGYEFCFGFWLKAKSTSLTLNARHLSLSHGFLSYLVGGWDIRTARTSRLLGRGSYWMEKARKHMPSSSSFLVILLHLIKILFSGRKFAHATDTLLPGQSLSGNQTLLSKYGAFKLGFNCRFPPCYLDSKFGIWYMNSSSCSPLLVWAPAADFSVFDPSSWSFGFSQGGLELRNDMFGQHFLRRVYLLLFL